MVVSQSLRVVHVDSEWSFEFSQWEEAVFRKFPVKLLLCFELRGTSVREQCHWEKWPADRSCPVLHFDRHHALFQASKMAVATAACSRLLWSIWACWSSFSRTHSIKHHNKHILRLHSCKGLTQWVCRHFTDANSTTIPKHYLERLLSKKNTPMGTLKYWTVHNYVDRITIKLNINVPNLRVVLQLFLSIIVNLICTSEHVSCTWIKPQSQKQHFSRLGLIHVLQCTTVLANVDDCGDDRTNKCVLEAVRF